MEIVAHDGVLVTLTNLSRCAFEAHDTGLLERVGIDHECAGGQSDDESALFPPTPTDPANPVTVSRSKGDLLSHELVFEERRTS